MVGNLGPGESRDFTVGAPVVPREIDPGNRTITVDLAGYSTDSKAVTLQYSFRIDALDAPTSSPPVASTASSATTALAVDRDVTCQAVDTNGTPLHITDSFERNQEVHWVLHCTERTEGDTAEVNWYCNKALIKTTVLEITASSAGYQDAWLGTAGSNPTGAWRADLVVNGKVVRSTTFTVTP